MAGYGVIEAQGGKRVKRALVAPLKLMARRLLVLCRNWTVI
jgi:hypothetical protein